MYEWLKELPYSSLNEMTLLLPVSTFALPSKDFKVCQIAILRKIAEISHSSIIMDEWAPLSQG